MSVVTETAAEGAVQDEGVAEELDTTTTEGEEAPVDTGGDFLSAEDSAIEQANTPEEYVALLAKANKAAEAKVETEDKPVEGEDEGVKEGDKPDADPESEAEDPAKDAEQKEKLAESDKDEQKPAESESKDVVDYEAEYKRLLAPFKANGHEIKVKSVEDAISLMQMGANYNKKMAALKPSLKLMKMLESSGFMSEQQVGFLIDLGKKDPAAINKLISESGINPMDLDAEKASGYKQTTFAPTDTEQELDSVLEELSSSDHYLRTVNVVGKEWDAASRDLVAGKPAILRVINDHMERGIYDRIEKEVASERLFGRLSGLSDIEAYRQVGDAMNARGEFTSPVAPEEKPAKKPVVVEPAPKKVEDDKLKEKRRAASSTKPVASTPVKEDFNPLNLPDDEFLKIANAKYK